jgi:hypothetical protein
MRRSRPTLLVMESAFYLTAALGITSSSTFKASDGDGYELVMGRWSRGLAEPSLDFSGSADGEVQTRTREPSSSARRSTFHDLQASTHEFLGVARSSGPANSCLIAFESIWAVAGNRLPWWPRSGPALVDSYAAMLIASLTRGIRSASITEVLHATPAQLGHRWYDGELPVCRAGRSRRVAVIGRLQSVATGAICPPVPGRRPYWHLALGEALIRCIGCD